MKLDKKSTKKFGIKVFQSDLRNGAKTAKKAETSKKKNVEKTALDAEPSTERQEELSEE